MGDLCQGFPDEFKVYIEYCRALRFDDAPDYHYLRKLFSDLMKRKVKILIFVLIQSNLLMMVFMIGLMKRSHIILQSYRNTVLIQLVI